MTQTRQMFLAVALLLTSVAVAFFVTRGEATPGAQGPEGHDHAAMGGGGDELRPVRLDHENARRIGVTFATVEERALAPEIQTVGIVTYDETRIVTVNPKVEGWVERLYVDFTGAPVRRGQPLLEVYSPKLVSAQEELILARRLVDETATTPGSRAAGSAEALLESARRRLAYWDIPADEIARIEASDQVNRTLTLRAPASGIVVEKNLVQGDRIMPGMTLYRIADLSTVWIEADVFERDLGLVRLGQSARIGFDAYPGRGLEGRITYVYPTVSVESRTGRIRLELPNPGLDLKPGMYADIHLDVPDGPSTLVVPRSAVLSTGERSVVFVQSPDGALVPRAVRTGRVAGREVEVVEGLASGDRVVSSAAFLIDAESNLGPALDGLTTAPDPDHQHD